MDSHPLSASIPLPWIPFIILFTILSLSAMAQSLSDAVIPLRWFPFVLLSVLLSLSATVRLFLVRTISTISTAARRHIWPRVYKVIWLSISSGFDVFLFNWASGTFSGWKPPSVFEDLARKVESIERERDYLNTANKELSERLSTIQNFSSEVDFYQRGMSQKAKELEAMSAKHAKEVSIRANNSSVYFNQQQREIRQWQSKAKEYRTQNESNDTEIKKLKTEIGELEKKLEEYENPTGKWHKETADMQAMIRELRSTNATLDRENNAPKSKLGPSKKPASSADFPGPSKTKKDSRKTDGEKARKTMKKSSETIESKYTALQQKLTAIMQMVTSINAPSTSNDNNTCPPQGLAERVQGILEDPKISPKPESPQPKAQIIKVRGASIIIAPAEVTDSADTPPLTLADLEKNIEQLFKDQQDATALLSRIRNTVDTVGKDLNLGAGAATPPEDFINLLAAKLGESQKGIAFLDEGSWQVAKSLSNALSETGQEEPSSYGTFDGLLGGIDNLKGAALTAQKNQASMSERVNNAIKGAIMGTGLVCTPEEFFPKIVTEVGNLKKKAEDRDHLNSKIQTLEASHKAEKDGLVSKMENLEASHKAEKAGLVGKIQTLEASHKAETDRLNGKIQTNLATPPILTNNPPAVPARPPFQASFTSTTSGQQRNAPPQGWIPEDDRVPKVDMGRLINPTKKKAFSGPILGGPIRRNPPSVGFNLTLPTGGVSTPPLPKTTTSTLVTEDEINEHRIKMARIYQLEARLINAKVLEEESDELGNALDSGRDMHCSRRVRHNLQMDHMSRRIPELESMYRDEVTVNLPAFPVNGRRQFADIFDQVNQRLAVDHENVPDDQRTRPQGWAKDDPRGKSKRSMED